MYTDSLFSGRIRQLIFQLADPEKPAPGLPDRPAAAVKTVPPVGSAVFGDEAGKAFHRCQPDFLGNALPRSAFPALNRLRQLPVKSPGAFVVSLPFFTVPFRPRGIHGLPDEGFRNPDLFHKAACLFRRWRPLFHPSVSSCSFPDCYRIWAQIAAKDSSERSCSILQASSLAIFSGTPSCVRYFVSAWCRS